MLVFPNIPVLHVIFLLLSSALYSQTGWYQLNSGSSTALFSVNFPASGNGSTGYAVGSAGTILATTNGGLNWMPQISTQGTDLESVFFLNTQIGWAAGANGVIIHTTNAGTNWTLQPAPTSLIKINHSL